MTTPGRTPAGPRTRQAATPSIPPPQTGEKDLAETKDPYDLPFPDDRWPRGRPTSWIVVDQLRGWVPRPTVARGAQRRRRESVAETATAWPVQFDITAPKAVCVDC